MNVFFRTFRLGKLWFVIIGDSEAAPREDDEEDPKKYCFCAGLGGGLMVACDNGDCVQEWFHGDCVGIKCEADIVGKKWYCPSCSEKLAQATHRADGLGLRPRGLRLPVVGLSVGAVPAGAPKEKATVQHKSRQNRWLFFSHLFRCFAVRLLLAVCIYRIYAVHLVIDFTFFLTIQGLRESLLFLNNARARIPPPPPPPSFVFSWKRTEFYAKLNYSQRKLSSILYIKILHARKVSAVFCWDVRCEVTRCTVQKQTNIRCQERTDRKTEEYFTVAPTNNKKTSSNINIQDSHCGREYQYSIQDSTVVSMSYECEKNPWLFPNSQ